MQVKKIGVYGYGAFGKLMAKVLSNFFEVNTYSRSLKIGGKDKYAKFVSQEELAKSDLIVFSVPVQFLESAIKEFKKDTKVPQSTYILDVSSVKEYPMKIMKKYFPKNPRLGTHPIFGPQSYQKYGLKGSKIVLCQDNLPQKDYRAIKKFLEETLGLVVIEKSAKEHDKEMALVQGITHFIGRALAIMDIEDYSTGTFSYKHLIELKDLLKDDSWELFETIQNFNRYTVKERGRLLKVLKQLNDNLTK